jgi:hypothetical protein
VTMLIGEEARSAVACLGRKRRMVRGLLNFVTLLSLLLFLGVIVLWVRSNESPEWCSLRGPRSVFNLLSGGGWCVLQWAEVPEGLGPPRWRTDAGEDLSGPGSVLSSQDEQSLWSRIGLISIRARVPWDPVPVPAPAVAAYSTIEVTCRNVWLGTACSRQSPAGCRFAGRGRPSWHVVAPAGFLPACARHVGTTSAPRPGVVPSAGNRMPLEGTMKPLSTVAFSRGSALCSHS